jgi:hypothetical protein
MQLVANTATTIARPDAGDDAGYQLAGLLIIALFPALFWTAVVAGIGAVIGYTLAPAALMAFGASVAAFLGLVCQALFSRN